MTSRGPHVPAHAPSHEDPVLTAASGAVGGPVGAHSRPHPWWTPVRMLLLITALTFTLGMVQRLPCADVQWTDGQLAYTHMCYSDMPYLYTGRGFVEGQWPYDDDERLDLRYSEMEYPVGISYWAYAAGKLTLLLSGSPDVDARAAMPFGKVTALPEVRDEAALYVGVNAVGLGAMALLASWFLAGVNRGRAWDAAGFAASPLLVLNGLINWDLIAVAATAAVLWAWARGRPGLAGLLIGLGTAIKLYPLFLLGGILVICVRRRRWGDLLLATSTTIAAWVAANLPAYLTGPESWMRFWTFNEERGGDLGSLWLALSQSGLWQPDLDLINRICWAFFVLWCGAVFVLGIAAPISPRLAQLGFLIVAGFLLVNKVYSPQYVLWLLPLAVLARPRWRDLLIWQAAEAVYFLAVWLYLSNWLAPSGGGDSPWYWAAIVIRILGQLYLIGVVARDVIAPQHDPAEAERVHDDLEDDWDDQELVGAGPPRATIATE